MQVLLVGGGKMGNAMLECWLSQQICTRIAVVDPNLTQLARSAAQLYPQPTDLPSDFAPEVVVLAVKPQLLEQILPLYQRFEQSLIISIAAGKTLTWLAQHHPAAAIVRAMPNIPAAIGRGMTVCCANSEVLAEQRTLAQRLFQAVGSVAWLEDESSLDVVTAISGSGPAYLFLLIETLAQVGAKYGLPATLATQLARVTVEGSAELAYQHPQRSLADLRQSVTSPGGTTLAALEVLMNPVSGMSSLFEQAIATAILRAKQL